MAQNSAPPEAKARWQQQHDELMKRLHDVGVLIWSIKQQNGDFDTRKGLGWEPQNRRDELLEAKILMKDRRERERRKVMVTLWDGEEIEANEAPLAGVTTECSFCGTRPNLRWSLTWPQSKAVICVRCRKWRVRGSDETR